MWLLSALGLKTDDQAGSEQFVRHRTEIVSRSDPTRWKYAPHLLQCGKSSRQVKHHHKLCYSVTFLNIKLGQGELF